MVHKLWCVPSARLLWVSRMIHSSSSEITSHILDEKHFPQSPLQQSHYLQWCPQISIMQKSQSTTWKASQARYCLILGHILHEFSALPMLKQSAIHASAPATKHQMIYLSLSPGWLIDYHTALWSATPSGVPSRFSVQPGWLTSPCELCVWLSGSHIGRTGAWSTPCVSQPPRHPGWHLSQKWHCCPATQRATWSQCHWKMVRTQTTSEYLNVHHHWWIPGQFSAFLWDMSKDNWSRLFQAQHILQWTVACLSGIPVPCTWPVLWTSNHVKFARSPSISLVSHTSAVADIEPHP